MNAISNENLKNGLNTYVDWAGFTPNLTLVHDGAAKTIVTTDASTYPSGDSRKIVRLEVFDINGKKAVGNILAGDSDNAVTISTAALDNSGGYVMLATVVSDKGRISDGHAQGVGASFNAGAFGSWDSKEVTK